MEEQGDTVLGDSIEIHKLEQFVLPHFLEEILLGILGALLLVLKFLNKIGRGVQHAHWRILDLPYLDRSDVGFVEELAVRLNVNLADQVSMHH